MAKADAVTLLDIAPDEIERGLATMSADRKLELYRAAKRVEAVASRVREALRLHVEATGDVIAEDARLTITTEKRRVISGAKAGQIIQPILAAFDDDAYDQCLTVRLSKLEEHVAKAAGRSKGAAAKRALNEELEAAGAISTTEINKLTERRA